MVTANVAAIKWFYPTESDGKANHQFDKILYSINKQSDSISTLEKNISDLNSEFNRVDKKINQQGELITAVDELRVKLANQAEQTPATQKNNTTPPVPDELLTKIDKQFTDLQQQITSLQSIQNQLPLNNNTQENAPIVPDPYAGMSEEQIEQQQIVKRQEEKQFMDTAVSSTLDPGKSSQIAGRFEAHMNSVNIINPPPKVSCGSTICHFQFDKPILMTTEGEEIDAIHAMMASGSFPADGTARSIVTQSNTQGGMDLYVGDAATFPKEEQ